ncbi:MAG: hypothetical protein K6C09_01470 [Oscillospiraceae bacterium]|nr:hypothetical protein [Oscillospiraceae bacterium]
MKYGESAFIVLYLLFAAVSGVLMLVRADGKNGRRMGAAALILGAGDAFHLVPRVLDHFSSGDLTAALGIGKLVTSLTMTVFYVLLYYIWSGVFRGRKGKGLTAAVWLLAALRLALCLLPQNGWLRNSADALWGTVRNVPFTALGIIVMALFFRTRRRGKRFRSVWLYILLSFLFYLPVAVGAGAVPALGMLMIPKTVCYVLILITFLRYVTNGEEAKGLPS